MVSYSNTTNPNSSDCDDAYLSTLLKTYQPIIFKRADKFARRGTYNHDLLVLKGQEAVFKAACLWDSRRGAMKPYISQAIRNDIYEECRRTHRREKFERLFSSYESEYALDPEFDVADILPGLQKEHDGFDEVDHKDALPVIHGWLAGLSQQERRLIDLMFFAGKNQSQAATEMGLSKSRVNQLYAGILTVGKIALADIGYLN